MKKAYSVRTIVKGVFWFLVGALLGFFLLVSFAFIVFKQLYANRIYSGVMVNGIDFGGKTKIQTKEYFEEKNNAISQVEFAFAYQDQKVNVQAKMFDYGYDAELLANQAYSIGRSQNAVSNISLIFQAYIQGIQLSSSYHLSSEKLRSQLSDTIQNLTIEPIDALFQFENGKVVAFRPSMDGQAVDMKEMEENLLSLSRIILSSKTPKVIDLALPVKVVKPDITTDKANSLGIKELIGKGESLFKNSIQSRIYNIILASSRLNGVLVKPNEEFSFNKALGDVSAFTGYQQAYIIQNGRTVLGDGGGVCQVSTTLFRAMLNAGLPITERHAHAYRVGYYEQDSPVGFDATIYVPRVDLKFKNDTGNHILIQTEVDPNQKHIAFYLYGTQDGRSTTITKPVVTSQIPPPEPLYQDDPSLPKGVIKQVDYEAPGAKVTFTREVSKNGKVVFFDTFVSNYRAWQAVYLRGTKE